MPHLPDNVAGFVGWIAVIRQSFQVNAFDFVPCKAPAIDESKVDPFP